MHSSARGSLMIIGASLGFGMIPMLAQLMMANGFSADVITLYRFLIPMLIFIVFFRPAGLDRWEVLRTFLVGMLSGLGMVLFMRALQQTSAVTIILLYYCYPFFSIVIGALLFGQRITRNSLATSLLILVAVSLTLSPQTIDVQDWTIVLSSLLAPVSFALVIQYFAHSVKPMAASQRMVISLMGTLLVVLPLTLMSEAIDIYPKSMDGVLWLLVLGLFSAALPQYLFIKGAPVAGANLTAGLSSLEVVVAMLLGVSVLGQEVTQIQITAALLLMNAQLIRQENINSVTGSTSPPIVAEPELSVTIGVNPK